MRQTPALILVVALTLHAAPARAADDPAVVACEGGILLKVPPQNYRRLSGSIDGHLVSIDYQLSTELRPKQVRCAFTLEPGKGWSFDTSNSPEGKACMRHTDQVGAMIRAGATTRAKKEVPRIKQCLEILKAEQMLQVQAFLVTVALMNRSAYPIPAETTALKRP